MRDTIDVTSRLPVNQRAALEQLVFFNVNQHRVRVGIQQSIEAYGTPEIVEQDGWLRIRVGDLDGQTLFAVSAAGRPLGVAIFARLARERFVVLHLGVEPRLQASIDANPTVLLRLMHEIRAAARRTRGVDRIEVLYKERPAMRSNS